MADTDLLDYAGLRHYDSKIKGYVQDELENYVDLTTNQTIDGEKLFRCYTRVKPKSFSVGYAVFPCDTYASRTDTLDSLAIFDNSDKRLCLIRTIDKDSNGNRYTNIYAMPASGSILGSTALTIGLLDVDGASIGYAQAPGTPEYEADGVTKRTAGGDIVTRNWIPKDTRIVHTTGNETIAGSKTFSSPIVSSTTQGMCRSNTQSVLVLYGGTSSDYSGATISLYGATRSTNPGHFHLTACTSSTNSREFYGTPGGSLVWNGQAIQTTSDERLKTTLSTVPDAILDAWEDVNWGQFQYLDAVASKGDSARLHLGLIAQHVMSVFEKHGLDACDYGILCHEERPAVDEEETVVDAEAYTNEEGVEHPAVTHVETRHEDAIDLWMVRYTEALAMEAACQRRRAERAEARLAALEERLATLEAKLS